MMRGWWRRRRGMPARGGGLPAGATVSEIRDERLSLYLDGDLPEGEQEAHERELASDAGSRAALEGMREVTEALRALGAGELGELRAPRPFTLAAPPARRGLIRTPGVFGEPSARLGALAAALAAVALVAVVGIGVGPGFDGREAQEEAAAVEVAASAPGTAERADDASAGAEPPITAADSPAGSDQRDAGRGTGARVDADDGAPGEGAAVDGRPESEPTRRGETAPDGPTALLVVALTAGAGVLALAALAAWRSIGRRRV